MILLAFFFVHFLQLSFASTCDQTDSRGVHWVGEEEEIVVKPCSFASFTLSGNATWRCDGGGHFDSQEPDRRDCVSSEISDAMDVEGLPEIIDGISLDRELTGGEVLLVVELLSSKPSTIESLVDVADRLLGMPLAWMELIKSPDPEPEQILGNTETFHVLEELIKQKLEHADAVTITKTNIVAEKGVPSGTSVTFPNVTSGSHIEVTTSGSYSGLLLKGPILGGLYKRHMDGMNGKEQLDTQLVYIDVKDAISDMVLHLDVLNGAEIGNDPTCAFLNQVASNIELWQLNGKDDSTCQAVVEEGGLICNCSTTLTSGINMYGGFVEASKTTTTTTSTTSTTTTTTKTTTSSTHSNSTTTQQQGSTTSSGNHSTEGNMTSQPSTTSIPCVLASPMPITLPLSIALLILAQIALVVVAVIHLLRNRVLPKFLNIIFLAIIMQVFATNWIFLGIVYQRDAERSSCDFSTLSSTVDEHRGVYTVLGPIAAFLWQSTLLSLFSFLLVTFLDLRSWQGSQSLTSLCTLASLVLLVPTVLTVVSCVATEYGADSYLPVLIPQKWMLQMDLDIEFDQAWFDQADTMVIALTVVLLVTWLLALSPFADITRQILDPETRRAVLTKKPYARFVHHVTASQLLLLPPAWITLIASQEEARPEAAAHLAFPALCLLAALLLLITVICWTSQRCLKPNAPSIVDRTDTGGGKKQGVLQWYLHTRAGRRQSQPPGIRGTLGRNLKPKQEASQALDGKEEADHQAGSRRPTVPRVQEETSSKSSTSSSGGEEEEYSARRTVEREGREVRREMRDGKQAGARWSEKGVDLPKEQRQDNGLVERKSEREGKTRSHVGGLSKRQSHGTKPEHENIVRRNQKPQRTGSEREWGDLDTRTDEDNREGRGWGSGGVWERARRGVYPTTSESSDPEEATYYAAVRSEGAQKSAGRRRQESHQEVNQGGRGERHRDRIEERRGMRRGWTEEIEQGWRNEMARTEDLEKRKHQRRQLRPEKPLGSLQSDAKILGYDTKLGAVPRDLSAWRQPLEPEGASRMSAWEKEPRSRWEGPVDMQSSPNERYVSNMERWRGQDLEKEQQRERLRLGSGAVTAIYKEHHYSSRA